MKKILLQLDPDPHPSVFDAVVAIDCGVDALLQYRGVQADDVRDLVHGAIFTRGQKHLKNTAIFVGGRDVLRGEQILTRVRESFFGPLRVSVMLDANGANTTSVAAVIAAGRHLDLATATATVLGGTGSVGSRIARLLAAQGGVVKICSRSLAKAEEVVTRLVAIVPDSQERLIALEAKSSKQIQSALDGATLVIAAGAAGVPLLTEDQRSQCQATVLIDLNAVPPTGIGWVPPTDSAVLRGAATCYGALGVGGLKMKIHQEAIRQLYSSNDLVLDVVEIFELGREVAQRDWA